MKYGTIDIGSNSVRLMISDGIKSIKKFVKTTRLASGLNENMVIDKTALDTTCSAVFEFIKIAKSENVEDIFIFGTATLRRATNGVELVEAIENKTGIKTDIISGETEAKIGYMGSLGEKDGGVIDIGGASTEIVVVKNGRQIYSKSVYVGAVSITKEFGQNQGLVESAVIKEVSSYGEVPSTVFCGIGGTITTVSAMLQGLTVYDPLKVDGYFILKEDVLALKDKLYSLSVGERERLNGLQKERASVIHAGVSILYWIMDKLKIKGVYASEKDNLEGYLQYRLKINE